MSETMFCDVDGDKHLISLEEDDTSAVPRIGAGILWEVYTYKVKTILPDLEDGLVVVSVEMTGEVKREIMDREDGGDSGTLFEVKAVMEDKLVLTSFYVDPEDPITIETGIGDPLGTVPSSEREDTRGVLSG